MGELWRELRKAGQQSVYFKSRTELIGTQSLGTLLTWNQKKNICPIKFQRIVTTVLQ